MSDKTIPARRKLIEASIPLEKINEQSAREKSIRHGHPSTLHLWWSRKPTATARAVLFAQIVDDPSTRPDLFPTTGEQEQERRELFRIIEEISNWDTVKNDRNGAFDEARERILLYTDGNPPPVADPFAGGGSIPLEAQRLGLEAHASDVNPVAVLLEKALIEIPAQFANQPPVHPDASELLKKATGSTPWQGATGLAEDVRRYGEWMLEQAKERIGHLYPNATLEDGTKVPVIAWLWARTVKCPNPACGIDAPLTSSWWVSKKKGHEAYVVPVIEQGDIRYEVVHGKEGGPDKTNDGTINGRTGGNCIACGASLSMKYIRKLSSTDGLGNALMAIVASGNRQRLYLTPDPQQLQASDVRRPNNLPSGSIALNPRWFSPPQYGITEFSDLFTNRQITTLTTFSDLVRELREEVKKKTPFDKNKLFLASYADAISTIISICVSKLANTSAMTTTWMTDRGAFRETFSRQALPMSWDYAESNPLGSHGSSPMFSWEVG